LKHSFLKVWRYWHVKQSKKLTEKNNRKGNRNWKVVCHLRLDYLFIGVIKQPIHPPIMTIILVLWNRKFNYYKEQCLELTTVKHKLKVVSSSRVKRMVSKMKNIDMEIQNVLLDQIHFPTCMYITMWVTKEEHA